MKLPDPLRSTLETIVGDITQVEALGGGCISNACRVMASQGSIFLKYDQSSPPGFFAVESKGLRALKRADSGLEVPEVLGFEDSAEGWSWLALDWLEPCRPSADASDRLGRGLATLHRCRDEQWGWDEDGFIGTLAQRNEPASDWPAFWWENRLRPQLEIAGSVGGRGDWDRLEEVIPSLVSAASPEGPSLLHGDLWGGNVLWSAEGPALVDPSSYFGHREVDLAMSELFGGFDRRFYSAYREAWPLEPGYEARKPVYQLYYLLVHINLFGASYVPRTLETLRRALDHA